jgi:hypothetical protein
MGRIDMHIVFWWGKLKEEHSEVLGVGGRILLKTVLKKHGEGVD